MNTINFRIRAILIFCYLLFAIIPSWAFDNIMTTTGIRPLEDVRPLEEVRLMAHPINAGNSPKRVVTQEGNETVTRDEHGIITDVQGEVKYYTRSATGTAYLASGGSMEMTDQSGIVQIVEDGDNVYIKDPVSRYSQNSWVKGVKSGNTITVATYQPLAFIESYHATISLRWGVITASGNILTADSHADAFTFTVDGDTITLEGTESFANAEGDAYFMGAFWDDDDSPTGYGDAETVLTYDPTYEPPSLELVEVPETATVIGCLFSGIKVDNDGESTIQNQPCTVAFDGNEIYVKGFDDNFPDSWFKGTLEKNGVVTFDKLQFMGEFGNYSIWVIGYNEDTQELCDITAIYNPDLKTITFTTSLLYNAAEDRIYYLGWYKNLILNKVQIEYEVQAATPIITQIDDKITISCATPDSTIYYTIGGETPTDKSSQYTEPITILDNREIKAIAYAPMFNPSELASYTPTSAKCQAVSFTFEDNTIYLSCPTENAEIHYTLDGSTPTHESSLYTEPIKITHDCVVKAIAVKEYMNDSDVAEYTIDSLMAKIPTFSFSNGVLSIECTTPASTIYYTIGGEDPTDQSTLYTEPITLEDNREVKAIAYAENFKPSSVATYTPTFAKCSEVVITLDDRTVTLSCAMSGASIYYTTDGSEPTRESQLYDTSFNVEHNCTIKALAVQEYYNDSEVTTYVVDSIKATTPEISQQDDKVTITCATPGATIYYTIGGDTPTDKSSKYTEPITILDNREIKAIAYAPMYCPSEMTSYTPTSAMCQAVSFTFEDNTIYLSCPTENAEIHYTLDGSTPTHESSLYTEPIKITHNCVVKATAVKEYMNDSDVAEYTIDSLMAEMPTFSFSNGVLSIECTTPASTIYYTIGGEDPTDQSTLYTEPITLEDNREVKAIAYAENFKPSNVANYTPTFAKCADIEFNIEGSLLTMSCSTADVFIHYTLNGATPTVDSNTYVVPLQLNRNGVVKAIAIKDYFQDSEISSYNIDIFTDAPAFEMECNVLTLSCSMEDAQIRYTIGGDEPTETSTLYTEPFTVVNNRILKAKAFRDGCIASPTVSFVPELSVANPIIKIEDNFVTITTETENASIKYSIGNDNLDLDYEQPIRILDRVTIKAMAFADYLNPSEIVILTPNNVKCMPVTVDYDGQNMILTTETPNATILYTNDGSTPNDNSICYYNQFDVHNAKQIKAIVKKDGLVNSQEMTYNIPTYYADETLYSNVAGNVADSFITGISEDLTTLRIIGNLDSNDIQYIGALPTLRFLNMADATVKDNKIPDKSFANSNIKVINMPGGQLEMGSRVFENSNSLCAIIWNSTKSISGSSFEGMNYSNLLVYAKMKSLVPATVTNVVINDFAENIVINDGAPFFCPQEFTAKKISYTHNYEQSTLLNYCAGWESICLPFDVDNITHEKNGAIAPFAANESAAKPFWLYSLGEKGWEAASSIRAYQPYIISMPNNEAYGDDFILSGKVTFAATNAIIPITTIKQDMKGELHFVGTVETVEQDDDVYALNVGESYVGNPAGSVFVGDSRDVNPFEAYLTFANNSSRQMAIRIDELNENSALPSLMTDELPLKVYVKERIVYIEAPCDMHIEIVDMRGLVVRLLDIDRGVNVIDDLETGVYFINNNKIFVK